MRYVIITLLLLFTLAGGFLGGMAFSNANQVEPTPTPYPTGKEVLEELNAYRMRNGLEPFVLSETLCDNIVERWQNYRDNGSHKGFAEFMSRQYPPGFTAAEIIVDGQTAKQMVELWSNSPSHDLYIKTNSRACVYSHLGSSVAILSN